MERSLVTLFRDASTRFAERTAIIDGGRSIRYETLSKWAAAAASFLRKEGLRPGDRVAILVPNSAEYAAIYYGILAAGGAVVALNTAAKARDLSNWVAHSECRWLFAQANHPELGELLANVAGPIRVVEVGDTAGELGTALDDIFAAGGGFERHPTGDEAETLAAIIYTSGTTGRPKGVMLSHANLYSNTRSIIRYLGIDCEDRVLNVLPFYYSYGNSVLHTHLAVGGTVLLENSLLFPHRVLERLVVERATGFSGVPATFALLLNRTRLESYDLSSVRYLTQAGGPMAPASIERLRAAIPHADFYVMYGQTEAAARLSYLPPERLTEKMGSIGIAIPDVELDIRDEQQNSVPPRVTGEICARGPNVMMGYWRDPEMTATVLRGGWLRTGDLAYRDPDGYYYIVGRSSEMIKSGAHRVSPKEIEEVILELPGVEEVAAIGVPDELLGETIKVVVVPASADAPSKRAIQAHCRANLATYKIPKSVEFAKEIPKTASGKIRRFLLQQQSMEQS
jgi:acyl-CoA synthetase (AMP-forming)/AMP-acid ligase II